MTFPWAEAAAAASACFAESGRPDLAEKWRRRAAVLAGQTAASIEIDPATGKGLVYRLCATCRSPFSLPWTGGAGKQVCFGCTPSRHRWQWFPVKMGG